MMIVLVEIIKKTKHFLWYILYYHSALFKYHENLYDQHKMGLIVTKPVFRVSDKSKLKLVSSVS